MHICLATCALSLIQHKGRAADRTWGCAKLQACRGACSCQRQRFHEGAPRRNGTLESCITMKSALDLISPGPSATGYLARYERSARQVDVRDSFFKPEGAAKPLANFGTVVGRHVMQLITVLNTIQTVVGRNFASENSHPRTCYCKTHYTLV